MMMSKIRQALSGFLAKRAFQKSPTLSALHERSEKLISEVIQNGIAEDIARGWAKQAFAHLLPALISQHPQKACRTLLVEWSLLDSDYRVMMIPPLPEPDWTGLRGLPGISGELRQHTLALAQTYEPIKDALHAASLEINKYTVDSVILVLASQAGYLMNIANTARIAIDDYHHDHDKDWFLPMTYSFCVSSENALRKLISLPTSKDQDMAALIHSTMMHTVLSGVRFPDITWRNQYQDQMRRGLISLPTTSVLLKNQQK
jgi:hypothetical protein